MKVLGYCHGLIYRRNVPLHHFPAFSGPPSRASRVPNDDPAALSMRLGTFSGICIERPLLHFSRGPGTDDDRVALFLFSGIPRDSCRFGEKVSHCPRKIPTTERFFLGLARRARCRALLEECRGNGAIKSGKCRGRCIILRNLSWKPTAVCESALSAVSRRATLYLGSGLTCVTILKHSFPFPVASRVDKTTARIALCLFVHYAGVGNQGVRLFLQLGYFSWLLG